MTVQTTTARAQYLGNGVTMAFATGFKFIAAADLVVTLTDTTTEVDTAQTLNTHYTVTGAGVAAGGTVTFLTPPTSGQRVTIERQTAPTQVLDYVPNDPFPAESHESGLDKLTMLIQENQVSNNRVLRLGAGDLPTTLNVLPSQAARASRVLGFDVTGQPVAGALIANIDAAIAAFLGGTSIGEISSVADIATMEALTTMTDGQVIQVIGYYAGTRVGGGYFQFVSGSSATVDDGVVFTAVGGRWMRVIHHTGAVYAEWWGLKADNTADDSAAAQAAIDYVNSSYLGGTFGGKAGMVIFPAGLIKLTGIVQKKGVRLIGMGSAQTVFLMADDQGTMVQTPAKASQLAADVISQCSIEGIGFGIHSSLTPTGTTVLLDSTGYTRCQMRDLFFTVPSNVIGIDNTGNAPAGSGGPSSWYVDWYSVHIYCTGGIGARFGTDDNAYEQVTAQFFWGGSVKGTSGTGMHIRAGTGWAFSGTTFEGLNSGSNNTLIIGDDTGDRTSRSINMFGGYLEQCRLILKSNSSRCRRYGTFETSVSVTDNGTMNGRVDNEQLYLGWPRVYVSAKVTVAAGVPTLVRGYNIDTVSRAAGTGIFDHDFTTDMPNANYNVQVTPIGTGAFPRISTQTTGAIRIVFENAAGSAVDPGGYHLSITDYP